MLNVCIVLQTVKLLAPIWVMLYAFQPNVVSADQEVTYPAYSEDGVSFAPAFFYIYFLVELSTQQNQLLFSCCPSNFAFWVKPNYQFKFQEYQNRQLLKMHLFPIL
jgi:hypothetical protein